MLVLSRRETERVRLGDSIVITVVRVAGDKVKLGIEAPTDMRVLRDELSPHERNAGDSPAPCSRLGCTVAVEAVPSRLSPTTS